MGRNPDMTLLKKLPQIEEILHRPVIAALGSAVPHNQLVEAARAVVHTRRESILAGDVPVLDIDDIASETAQRVIDLGRPSLRRVVNASGVIIHTNLGRSVLADDAKAAVRDVIEGYSTLEYDIDTMSRGSRHDHYEALVCSLTGAEAAIAVNNNAAAVMLVLSEFAADHEAVISRGELVEIGGSFRVPDIMNQSRAKMVEVGTTNKTRVDDYERAITDDCAMLLKVHPSNYRMMGFTEDVGIAELRKLAEHVNEHRDRDSKVLIYEDQGSGAFVDLGSVEANLEHTVSESLGNGADLVSFSGDKLLGGPQAGIIVGSRILIDRLKENPLARVLRLDKMTLAALEATLRLYIDPEVAIAKVPTLRMLHEPADTVRSRASRLAEAIRASVPADDARIDVIPEVSRAGGGALPMCDIGTYVVEITFERGDAQGCETFLVQSCPIPIITRIKAEKVLCDARTILDDDELGIVADGISRYFTSIRGER